MRSLLRHHRSIGFRGLFLMMMGVVYMVLGWALLSIPDTPPVQQAYRVAERIMPLHDYGWCWLGAGGLCVVAGLMSPKRKPLGFAVCSLMPALWATLSVFEWQAGDQPRGWMSAVLYAALAGGVLTVANLVEPSAGTVKHDE